MQAQTIKNIIYYLIVIILGCLFLLSAYSKLLGNHGNAIQNFEWTIAETGWFNFTTANILSRLIIIAETLIGLLLIFNISFNKKLFVAAGVLLVLFSIYLLFIIKVYGMHGNCGCFGDTLPMTPIQAIIKNIIMLLLLALAFYLPEPSFTINKILIFAIGITTPLLIAPPDFIYIKKKESVQNIPVNLDNLYTMAASQKPNINLREGKHLISILSTTCTHCKAAARKLGIMYRQNSKLPLYNIISGDSASLHTFLAETRMGNIPYQLHYDYNYISYLSALGTEGVAYPKFIWLNNGKAIRLGNSYHNLDDNELNKWINTK
jgi:hypothetical protein